MSDPAQDGSRKYYFGEVAVEMGLLTSETVDKALALQKSNPDRPHLGRLLIDHGILTPDDVQKILVRQRKLRTGNAKSIWLVPED